MTATLESRFLERPNARIHLRQRPAADGRWVVFLHGAGMDGHMFDAQLPAIPEDMGICVWDARGHGQSSLDGRFHYQDVVDDLVALLAELNAREVTLVGQSLGGHLAQTMVERHGEDLARVVLINCSDNHGPLTWLDKLGLVLFTPIMLLWPWSSAVKASAKACGNEASTIAYTQRALKAIGRRRFLQVMDFSADVLDPDPTYRLAVPALLLCGDDDGTGNVRVAMPRLAERDPNAHLVIIGGASHNSNMDRPDETNRHLVDFLEAGHDHDGQR